MYTEECADRALLPALFRSRHPNDVRLYFPREGKELWANSDVLKSASPYFKAALTSGFTESIAATSSECTKGSASDTILDFEDSDEESSGDEDDSILSTTRQEAQLSDSCGEAYQTITVSQATSKTYEAVLNWIVTGDITFARLSSRESDATVPSSTSDGTIKVPMTLIDGRPLPSRSPTPAHTSLSASPKSLYRLAHLLDIPQLQLISLVNIYSQLTTENVLYEVFSDVAGAYEVFRSLVVDYAVERWAAVKLTSSFSELREMAEDGETVNAYSALFELMAKLK